MMAVRAPQLTDEAPGVVASVARIDAWLSIAQPGDRFVYASRAVLPVASSGRLRMLTLSDRGLVLLIRPRCVNDPTIFNYTAIRTAKPTVDAKPAGRSKLKAVATPLLEDEVASTNAVFEVLERFANAGRPCPTDTQLGARTGLPREVVATILVAMRAANLIRIQPVSAPTSRRVHIVATGAVTGFMK